MFDQDVNQWMQFVQDRWWLILIALVALLLVISFVKTVVKWLLVAVIVAVVLIYGAKYKDELTTIGDKVVSEAKEQAFQALMASAGNAKYEEGKNGAFVVSTDTVRVEGKAGSDEVTVYWKDVRIGTFKVEGVIETFLNEAKNRL